MFTLGDTYSHSNSHSYGMAKSLIIAVDMAKLFQKLQLQAKFKTKLYLTTGQINRLKGRAAVRAEEAEI